MKKCTHVGCVNLILYLKIRSLEMAAASEVLDTGEGGDVSLNSKKSAKRFKDIHQEIRLVL
jgi:hypothetical protein